MSIIGTVQMSDGTRRPARSTEGIVEYRLAGNANAARGNGYRKATAKQAATFADDAPAPQLGDVVLIADIAASYAGIVEQISTLGEEVGYSVRGRSGMLYARAAAELTIADDETAEQVRRDVRVLAPWHPELLGAVRVLNAHERAHAKHDGMPAEDRDALVLAGVPFVLLGNADGSYTLSTLDARFEIVELADGTYVLRATANHATARRDRRGAQLASDPTLHELARIVARLVARR